MYATYFVISLPDATAYDKLIYIITCKMAFIFKSVTRLLEKTLFMGGSRRVGWGDRWGPDSRWKIMQLKVSFINSGTEPAGEAIGPLGSNCFSEGDRTTVCEIR